MTSNSFLEVVSRMGKDLAIATYGLTKRFDRHIAVNDLNLEIKSGEVYGLIGANGAGKTTLIKMLAGVEEPTLGEIYLNGIAFSIATGERLSKNNQNLTLRQRIGYLPDDYPLYDDLTVWDYLDYFARLYRLPASLRRYRIYEVLELIQLENKRNSLITNLSRGMKQRLSLGRTILHEPIILLLDEPVSGLDPISRNQFREIIKILQEAGMTIFISSHILSDLAELCTSVGIMELGFLVESGSIKDLCGRLARQQIIMNTLGDLATLQRELRKNPLVEEWEVVPGSQRLKVNFTGGELDSAELLRSLISAGISLTEFQFTQEDLETIFLKLKYRQAN